jgi:transposase-like protein
MIFPISDLLSVSESTAWLEQHFHPEGLRCPRCSATREEARHFRTTRRGLVDWRCRQCHTVFNVYRGTVFEKSGWSPVKAVLLIRGVCKGETSKGLAAELGVSRTTVLLMRGRLQRNGYATRTLTLLTDAVTETDEMFQNAGEKKRAASRPRRSAAPSRQQT